MNQFFQLLDKLKKFAEQCPSNQRGRPVSTRNVQELEKQGIDVCEKKRKRDGETIYYKTKGQREKEAQTRKETREGRASLNMKLRGRLSKEGKAKLAELKQKLSSLTQQSENISEPPGEGKSDLDRINEQSRRSGDNDHNPFVKKWIANQDSEIAKAGEELNKDPRRKTKIKTTFDEAYKNIVSKNKLKIMPSFGDLYSEINSQIPIAAREFQAVILELKTEGKWDLYHRNQPSWYNIFGGLEEGRLLAIHDKFGGMLYYGALR